MSIFLEAAIAAFAVAAVFALVSAVKNAARGDKTGRERIVALVYTNGGERLEHAVRSLLRTRNANGLNMEIILVSDTKQGACREAVLLARDYDGVHIADKSEVGSCISDL